MCREGTITFSALLYSVTISSRYGKTMLIAGQNRGNESLATT